MYHARKDDGKNSLKNGGLITLHGGDYVAKASGSIPLYHCEDLVRAVLDNLPMMDVPDRFNKRRELLTEGC